MKNINYINIQGWMINVLKLNGNELILYAVIYGFSQDQKTQYKGSLSYISNAIGITRRSSVNLITRLEGRNLIIKFQDPEGNRFEHNALELKRLMDGGEIFAPVKKVPSSGEIFALIGGEKSSHNNTYNNNKDNNIDFEKLLQYLNDKTGKKARVVNKSVKASFNARIKEGYTKEDVQNSIDNAIKTPYHIENNFLYLNIEFFSRSKIIDKYGFKSQNKTSSADQSGEAIDMKTARQTQVHYNF